MHPGLNDKPSEYFWKKKYEHEGQKKLRRATTFVNENVQRASNLVANRIAKVKKPFPIGEDLILSATKLREEAVVKKITQVSLSAYTVTQGIKEIAENIET